MVRHSHHTRRHHNNIDLSDDLAKIKSLLADTTIDAKVKAMDLLSQSIDDLKQKSADLQDNVTEYVTDKPFKSLGIALIAGTIIGYLLNRK